VPRAARTRREKKSPAASAPIFDPAERRPARGQQYSVGAVRWFVSLVIECHAPLRCAAGALGFFGTETGHEAMAPHASTGRLWLLRLGLWALRRPKVVADDWVWLTDHSIQIGQCKCLVILGIRLSTLPEGRPLCHADMELIALAPMMHSNKEAVAICLEAAVAETGVPRAILDDHGADLHGGVEIFRRRHPETVELYDIKHKAACVLKAHLERDEHWKSYASQLGQTKCVLQQTELAFLVPPSQRTKSRFMNLAALVAWGRKVLALVDDPSLLKERAVSAERVQAKLGWLRDYRAALGQWSAYHGVIGATLDFVRHRGLYAGAGAELAAALPVAAGEAGVLREELIAFVTRESAKARPGERLPGTTEVLESCFGRLKALESGQSKSGFTGLVLSLGALVSRWTAETIREALERCKVRDVWDWCRRRLGQSIQSRRKQAFDAMAGATNLG
jgi:hypothetical protein